MELNGITFNPKDIKGYSLADIGNRIVSLFRLNIEFPDDTEIIKVYKTIDKAKEVIDKIERGKTERSVCDGVTLLTDDNQLSSRYLTVAVDRIDALFSQGNMVYVLIGDDKYFFNESARVTLAKIAECCPHLTKVNDGVYINKKKSKGFFVTCERDAAKHCNILVSCNNVLFHVVSAGDFDAAVKHRDGIQESFDAIN